MLLTTLPLNFPKNDDIVIVSHMIRNRGGEEGDGARPLVDAVAVMPARRYQTEMEMWKAAPQGTFVVPTYALRILLHPSVQAEWLYE